MVPGLLSCNHQPDIEKERKAIQFLLEQERKAHFDRNADLFVAEFADSMIAVNKGKVTAASPDENKKRIADYFDRARFIKWDDTAEPLIRFSGDGTMAYAVIQKQVIVSYPDSSGRKIKDTTDYAWVSIYRKQQGEWKIETNISTEK